MAGGLGFEPRPAGPEPAVLPIRRSPSAFKEIISNLSDVKRG